MLTVQAGVLHVVTRACTCDDTCVFAVADRGIRPSPTPRAKRIYVAGRASRASAGIVLGSRHPATIGVVPRLETDSWETESDSDDEGPRLSRQYHLAQSQATAKPTVSKQPGRTNQVLTQAPLSLDEGVQAFTKTKSGAVRASLVDSDAINKRTNDSERAENESDAVIEEEQDVVKSQPGKTDQTPAVVLPEDSDTDADLSDDGDEMEKVGSQSLCLSLCLSLCVSLCVSLSRARSLSPCRPVAALHPLAFIRLFTLGLHCGVGETGGTQVESGVLCPRVHVAATAMRKRRAAQILTRAPLS